MSFNSAAGGTVQEQETRFVSILFPGSEPEPGAEIPEPDYFGDLNLDQIAHAAFDSRSEYALAPYFAQGLHDTEAVGYRQAVMRDLEHDEINRPVRDFALAMADCRKELAYARKLHSPFQRERWLLSALTTYGDAVLALATALADAEPASAALRGLGAYLERYVQSADFERLREDGRQVTSVLDGIRYTLQIRDLHVSVDTYQDQPDLARRVEETFARFRQGEVQSYRSRFPEPTALNPVEEQVLAQVAAVYEDEFRQLAEYCVRYRSALDPTVLRFDREVQFLLAYREYIAPLQAAGLAFAYPTVRTDSKEEHVEDAFDLALATRLVAAGEPVVTNDFTLSGVERVLVLTGPNQGGKTTFARMLGQVHHLAALGLPVPGRSADLFLPDRIFTHFERRESLESLRSKFEEEVYRIHGILDTATGDSLLIMNESFSSTTTQDALEVGERVLRQVLDRQMLCLYVTFIDELSRLSESVVSLMSTVDPDDPTVRTFRIVRKPADGLAHAVLLAKVYGLSYDQLKARLTA